MHELRLYRNIALSTQSIAVGKSKTEQIYVYLLYM